MVSSVNNTHELAVSQVLLAFDSLLSGGRGDISSLSFEIDKFRLKERCPGFEPVTGAFTLEEKITAFHSLIVQCHKEEPGCTCRIRKFIPVSLLRRSTRAADRVIEQIFQGEAPSTVQKCIIEICEIVNELTLRRLGFSPDQRENILSTMVEGRNLLLVLQKVTADERAGLLQKSRQHKSFLKELRKSRRSLLKIVAKKTDKALGLPEVGYGNFSRVADDLGYLIREIESALAEIEIIEEIYNKIWEGENALEQATRIINSLSKNREIQLLALARLAVVANRFSIIDEAEDDASKRNRWAFAITVTEYFYTRIQEGLENLSDTQKKVLFRATEGSFIHSHLRSLFNRDEPGQDPTHRISNIPSQECADFRQEGVVDAEDLLQEATLFLTDGVNDPADCLGIRVAKAGHICRQLQHMLPSEHDNQCPIHLKDSIQGSCADLSRYISGKEGVFEQEVKVRLFDSLLQQYKGGITVGDRIDGLWEQSTIQINDVYPEEKNLLFALVQLASIARKADTINACSEKEERKSRAAFAGYLLVCAHNTFRALKSTLSQAEEQGIYDMFGDGPDSLPAFIERWFD